MRAAWSLQRTNLLVHFERAGHDDDRQEREQLLQRGQKVQPKFASIQHMIENDQVWWIFGNDCQRFAASASAYEPIMSQRILVDFLLKIVVFKNENLWRSHNDDNATIA